MRGRFIFAAENVSDMSKDYLMIHKPDANNAVIEIDGTIGGWDWEEMKRTNTGADIRKQLKAVEDLDAGNIEVRITSLGGSVNDALQIHDALKAHKAKITTIVEGFCASAATIIALAGDVRKISPNALYLIHKCHSSIVDANENDLQAELDDQRTINGTIFNMYKQVCKKDDSDLRNLFEANNGTGKWITADEALDFGFATEIVDFETEKPLKNMARFLNHARNIFPEWNTTNNNSKSKKSYTMKNLLSSFALLGAALNAPSDAEFNENEGLLINMEEMQNIENALTEFENLKLKLTETETELQNAKEALSTAENMVETKSAEIETLTAERDSYKDKYENAPATNPIVNGTDPKAENSFDNYVDNDEYYQRMQSAL